MNIRYFDFENNFVFSKKGCNECLWTFSYQTSKKLQWPSLEKLAVNIYYQFNSRLQKEKLGHRQRNKPLKMYAAVNFAANTAIKVKAVVFCTFVTTNGFMWIVLCGRQKFMKRLTVLCKTLEKPWVEAED